MRRLSAGLCALAIFAAPLGAQDTTALVVPDMQPRGGRPSWVSRGDLKPIALALAGIAVASAADESLAKGVQRPSLQQSDFLRHTATVFRLSGDPGALIGSVSIYVVTRVTHRPGLADAALHATESIVASGAITQALKLSIGRARPSVTEEQNAFAFHPFHGLQTGFNSFPSGHATASFAAAGAFSEELRRTHPKAARWASPLLYGAAGLAGGSRMYDNRHWLSDVVAGAVIGQFTARRITTHAHGVR